MVNLADILARDVAKAARQRLAELLAILKHCLGQLSDEQVWWRPRDSMNCVANVLLHLSGNVCQWLVCGITEATDTRNRPQEFSERGPIPKAELVRRLEEAVAQADAALGSLSADRLLEQRRIQGFETTVLSAIFASVSHFNGHTQEIVYATRLQLGDGYRILWTPATPAQGAAP